MGENVRQFGSAKIGDERPACPYWESMLIYTEVNIVARRGFYEWAEATTRLHHRTPLVAVPRGGPRAGAGYSSGGGQVVPHGDEVLALELKDYVTVTAA